jgi:para-nitrobenzyl esterase
LANATNAYNQSTVDGQVLRETQLSALASGRINRVAVIQGANSHEGRFFVPLTLSDTDYLGVVSVAANASGKSFSSILAQYPLSAYPNPFEAASALYGDAVFACPAGASNQLLTQWVPTYAYEFDDANASPLGAMHSAELKYLFNLNFGGPTIGPSSLQADSQSLASTMRKYWTGFARLGNPNVAGAPDWPSLLQGAVLWLKLPAFTPESIANYGIRHKCAFWA